jgi:O-antigen/teichoic acid export membrane protein
MSRSRLFVVALLCASPALAGGDGMQAIGDIAVNFIGIVLVCAALPIAIAVRAARKSGLSTGKSVLGAAAGTFVAIALAGAGVPMLFVGHAGAPWPIVSLAVPLACAGATAAWFVMSRDARRINARALVVTGIVLGVAGILAGAFITLMVVVALTSSSR